MALNPKILNGLIIGLLILTLIFSFGSALIPEAQDAGNQLNESNQCSAASCFYNTTTDICFGDSNQNTSCATSNEIPLSGLTSGDGVIFLLIMGSIVLLIYKNYNVK